MFTFFSRFISWRFFFLGIVLSFITASFTGWIVTRKNAFNDFSRFYLTISPETLYFPTSRQLSAMVNDRYDPNKVMVIVGGSSVFRGTGQSAAGIWTKALQAELGDRFAVLNLAMNGGAAPGAGSYMTEFLVKSGRKVIFVPDMMPSAWDPDSSNKNYSYLYYDAQERNYLLDSKTREDYFNSTTSENRTTLKIRAKANRLFYFDDLWNYLGYCCFFTVYTKIMQHEPWLGRHSFTDTEVPAPGFMFQSEPQNMTAREVDIVRGYSKIVLKPDFEKRGLQIAFPEEIRRHMLIVATGQAPFYKTQISSDEQNKIDEFYATWQHIVNDTGISTAFADGVLKDEDHYDRVHLSEHGGVTLAKFLAPSIRNKAKELGYAQ